MADSLTLISRNASPNGTTQSVEILANKQAAPNAGYYLWTVQGIQVNQTDAQVQTTLNGMVATVISAIIANNEVPLTPEELANYQNIIDLQQSQTWLDNLKSDLDLILTATPFQDAPTGLKDAFSNANSATYDALSSARKFTLIRQTLNTMLATQADQIRTERGLLKRSMRVGSNQAARTQS